MNVVLATAPDEGSAWNRASFPPTGLFYLAAGVKKLAGARVELADVYAEGLGREQAAARILAASPDVLGITTTGGNVEETRDLLAAAKAAKPGLPTVVGGVYATMFDDVLLQSIPELDFVVRGEGDHSFPELCRRLMAGEAVAGVPGLSYRFNGGIVRGEPQLVADLDSLPFPDRSLAAPGLYGARWYGYELPSMAGRITAASSSRGCPFGCTFCSMVGVSDRSFRARSAANVYQELQQVREQGFELVIFWDDNFCADLARVRALCKLLIEKPLGLRFGFAATLHLLPADTLRLMQRAGFDLAFLGVESGSDRVLAAYRKPARRAALAAGIQAAKKAHMFTIASFIAGAPAETEEDFQDTLRFVREVRPHFCEVSPLMMHPGSPLWNEWHDPEPVTTLERTRSRPIWRFTDRVKKEVVEAWMKQFKQTFARTYVGMLGAVVGRACEFIGLMAHNKTIRRSVRMFLGDMRLVSQFLRVKLR